MKAHLEHIAAMIEAMLMQEKEEMQVAYDMFAEKRDQVKALMSSLAPLMAGEEDESEAVKAVNTVLLIDVGDIQRGLKNVQEGVVDALKVLLADKNNYTAKKRDAVLDVLRESIETMSKAIEIFE